MSRQLERLARWAAQPHVQALSEIERLRLAETELGLRASTCPKCQGDGCSTCDYDGAIYAIREEQ